MKKLGKLHSKIFLSVIGLVMLTLAISLRANNPTEEQEKLGLSVLARTDKDSVVLRWGTNSSFGWLALVEKGYFVQRVRILPDGNLDGSFQNLTQNPIMPWSLQDIKTKVTKDNKFSLIAAQMLYGKNKLDNPSPDNFVAINRSANTLSAKHGLALFAADNSSQAAEILGLRFVDKNIQLGEKYAYRILPAGKVENIRLDSAITTVIISPFVTPAAPMNFMAEDGDRRINLNWDRALPEQYSAYLIDRSDDNGSTYKRITQSPIMVSPQDGVPTEMNRTGTYSDTNIINYRTYKYRLYGVTPFGDLTIAAETQAMGRDVTPLSAPFINTPNQISKNCIKISWTMNEKEKDIKAFYIEKSSNKDAGFEQVNKQILPENTREFTDFDAERHSPYYRVVVADTAGNITYSPSFFVQMVDSTTPPAPTNLKGSIDSNGVVTLTWDAPKDPYIIGYRVLFANQADHHFAQLNQKPLEDTTFTDKVEIKTLTRHVYYKVIAENDLYVRSQESNMLELTRPDVVPPAQSIFTDVTVDDKNINLKWAVSPSKDLAKQTLMRKVQGETGWKSIAELGTSVKSYTDNKIQSKVAYEYTIITVDSSGLKSEPCIAVIGRAYGSSDVKSVTNLVAKYDEQKKYVSLNWGVSGELSNDSKFIIYRSCDNGMLGQYKSLSNDKREFTDVLINSNKKYQYSIIITTDNGDSPQSNKAMVSIK